MRRFSFQPGGSRHSLTITLDENGCISMGTNEGATLARKARALLSRMGVAAFLRECCTELEAGASGKAAGHGGRRAGAGRPKGAPATCVSFNLDDSMLAKWRAMPDKSRTMNELLRQKLGGQE